MLDLFELTFGRQLDCQGICPGCGQGLEYALSVEDLRLPADLGAFRGGRDLSVRYPRGHHPPSAAQQRRSDGDRERSTPRPTSVSSSGASWKPGSRETESAGEAPAVGRRTPAKSYQARTRAVGNDADGPERAATEFDPVFTVRRSGVLEAHSEFGTALRGRDRPPEVGLRRARPGPSSTLLGQRRSRVRPLPFERSRRSIFESVSRLRPTMYLRGGLTPQTRDPIRNLGFPSTLRMRLRLHVLQPSPGPSPPARRPSR